MGDVVLEFHQSGKKDKRANENRKAAYRVFVRQKNGFCTAGERVLHVPCVVTEKRRGWSDKNEAWVGLSEG